MGSIFVINSESDKLMASLIIEQAIQARQERFAAIQLQGEMAREIKRLKEELEQFNDKPIKEGV